MKLIKYDNYRITISDEAYLIKSIRELFNKDTSKHKETFFEQMTFIYFSSDVRSDYIGIPDLNERYDTIIKEQGLSKGFKVTKELKTAMDDYVKMSTTLSAGILEAAKITVTNIRTFMSTIDKDSINIKDLPALAKAMKDMPQIAKDLIETEKIVTKEIEETGRARGGNESKKLFEDGI